MRLHLTRGLLISVIAGILAVGISSVGLQANPGNTVIMDRSAKLLKEVKPNFPFVLKGTRIYEGAAKIVFIAGKDGENRDFVVLAATHPAYSDEAIRAIKKWEFSPAILNGQPADSRFIVNVQFKQEGLIVINDPIGSIGDIWHNQLYDFYYRITEINELDEPLKTISTVMPYFPEEMILYERSGQALVEFFIDPDGNVLAPGILSSSNDQCAYSALGAIVKWKYEPPLKKRKPVYVRAIQPFFFHFIEPPPAQLEDKGLLPKSG